MTDAEIEKLALEHESFGFGKIDSRGLTTHGFDPENLRDFARALLAAAQDRAMSEPVTEYQARMRPDWKEDWSEWSKCSAESAADYECTPLLHDWHYEIRRLYAAPTPKEPS